MKKYKAISKDDFVTCELIPHEKLRGGFKLYPRGYTRIDINLLREIFLKVPSNHVDITLYSSKHMENPLIRIGNFLIAPITDEWNEPRIIKIKTEGKHENKRN